MSDLFSNAGVAIEGDKWVWYLHGRELRHEARGWPDRYWKRVVIHFDDQCEAATEKEAAQIFELSYGKPHRHLQWMFIQGPKIKTKKAR